MTDNVVNLPSVDSQPVLDPVLGDQGQFASQRGLLFGPLRINKTGVYANNGTVDSVKIDSTGLTGYNNSNVRAFDLSATNVLTTYQSDGTSIRTRFNGTGAFFVGNTGAVFYDTWESAAYGSVGSAASGNGFVMSATGEDMHIGTLTAGKHIKVVSSGNLELTTSNLTINSETGYDGTFFVLDGDGVTVHGFTFTKGILTAYSAM